MKKIYAYWSLRKSNYLIILLLLIGCQNQKIERLEVIAKELLSLSEIINFESNKNHPTKGVVNIGKSLYRVLSNRTSPKDSISIEVQRGDFFKEKMDITHSILYETSDSELRIRLKYDSQIDKFHIVGYSGKLK